LGLTCFLGRHCNPGRSPSAGWKTPTPKTSGRRHPLPKFAIPKSPSPGSTVVAEPSRCRASGWSRGAHGRACCRYTSPRQIGSRTSRRRPPPAPFPPNRNFRCPRVAHPGLLHHHGNGRGPRSPSSGSWARHVRGGSSTADRSPISRNEADGVWKIWVSDSRVASAAPSAPRRRRRPLGSSRLEHRSNARSGAWSR